MNSIEDLLRRTFADRAQDVTEPPPVPAAPPRRRRSLVVLTAAAAAAVLVGTTLALHGAGPGAPDPSTATARPHRFRPAPLVSTDGRTRAVLDWVPAWAPTTATGYEVTPFLQARFYGYEDGEYAAIAIGKGDCKALQRPPTLEINLNWEMALVNVGLQYCRPLPGGGSVGIVMGGVSHAETAMQRMVHSIRFGQRDEIAAPIGFADGTTVNRMSIGAVYESRSRWQANVTGTDGTELYAGPAPYPLHVNRKVGGRPAEVFEHYGESIVRIMLSPTVWSSTASRKHDRTFAVAAGLHLGAVPDYPWVH